MREMMRLSLLLGFVCASCGALLAYVDAKTAAPRRATAEAKRLGAALAVLPVHDGREAEIVRRADGAFLLRRRADGAFLGAAAEGASGSGYAGEVRVVVGFDAAGAVVDFAVVSSHETPGLGARIAAEKFRAGFRGRPFDGSWKVKKDGGGIDAVTSATISSRAACEAVADAAEKFRALAARGEEGGK